jgi:hypothetical protein
MTTNTVWLLIGALVLLCAVIAWIALRKGKGDTAAPARPPEADTAAKVSAPPAVVAPATVAPPVFMAPPPPAAVARREAPRAAPAAPAPVPVAAPEPPSITIIQARPRPAVPQFEQVLALQLASSAEWHAAEQVALSPEGLATISAALPSAGNAARPAPAGDGVVFGLSFAPGSAMRVARGDSACLKEMAAANEGVAAASGLWLGSVAAMTIAQAGFGALASERYLDALNGEAQDVKALVTAFPPKLLGSDARLKTLVQELSRFLREARENYASAISKPAFRERVGEACQRAAEYWRELASRADAARRQLQTLADVPRFGEAQVEKSLGLLRELLDARRIQAVAGRTLAALHTLRTALGDAAPADEGDALQLAAAAIQAGADVDRELVQRLGVSESEAKGDPYVGKSEFAASRAAMRKCLEALGAPTQPAPVEPIEAAQKAAVTGLPGASGKPEQWFLRITASGVAGLRRSPSATLH